MNHNCGIYGYVEDGEVVYIGKDEYISVNARHKEHLKESGATTQWINMVLRKKELGYVVLATCLNSDIMNELESYFINEYKPKYNIRITGLEKERKKEYVKWKKENA